MSSSQAGAPTPHPPAGRFHFGVLAWLGVIFLAAGGAAWWLAAPITDGQLVTAVRIRQNTKITNPSGAADDLMSKLKRFGSQPDYFLRVRTDRATFDTATREDTPIGNGLTFDLPLPLRPDQVREIRALHDGLLSDTLIDRVDLPADSPPPAGLAGQVFAFELIVTDPDDPGRTVRLIAIAIAALGTAMLLLTLVRFVYHQAV